MSYALRLAVRGLWRTPGLTAALFGSLAVATGIWTSSLVHSLRFYVHRSSVPDTLHQVELPHTPTLHDALRISTVDPAAWLERTRVSFPHYQVLSQSGIPGRQVGTMRSRLLVTRTRPDGSPAADPQVQVGRFATADFFSVFSIPIARGRPFSRAEEAEGAAVAVLGFRLARSLFGRQGGIGETVTVEGRPFRVIGIVDGDQPYRPEWDVSTTGARQDAVYLPFAFLIRMRAWPEGVVHQGPVGPGFEALLRSKSIFVTFWADLTSPEQVAAYRRYLDDRFAANGTPYTLRAYPEWRNAFPPPASPVSFFSFLTGFLLLGAGFTMSRLELTRGIARHKEIGILRALGASRPRLLGAQLLETALVSIPASLCGVLLALPYNALFNRLAAGGDIPLRLDPLAVLGGALPACLVGLLSGLYPAWRLLRSVPASHLGRT